MRTALRPRGSCSTEARRARRGARPAPTTARAERALSQVRHQIDELSTALGQLGPDQVELVRVSPQAIADNPAVAATLDPAILVASLVAAAETEASLEQQLADLQAEIEAGHLRLVQTEQAHAEERGRLQTLDQVIEALHANLEDLREASRWEVVSAGKQRRQLARPGDALAHLGNALPETPPRTSGGVVEMSDEDEASAQSAESRTTLESWLKTRAGETWDPNPNDTDPEPRAEANETETTSDPT